MFYILYRFLNDPNITNKSFTLSFGLQKCFSFHHLKDNQFAMREFNNFCPDAAFKTQLFIFDSLQPEGLPVKKISNWNVFLASPNPMRFKYVSGLKYYMPVWTFEELKKIQNNTKNWKYLYNKYGGVPRYLFKSKKISQQKFIKEFKQLYEDALDKKGSYILNNFSIYGKDDKQGRGDEKKNHMLVHLNPVIKNNGKIDYNNYTEFFASDFIMLVLKNKDQDIFYKTAVNKLNSGKLDILKKFDLNILFQDLFTSEGAPVYDKVYIVKKLPLNSQFMINFTFPSGSIYFYNLTNLHSFEFNKLYISTNRIFKTVDAFYVNNGIFYGFQCTTANSHRLNSRGLLEFNLFFLNRDITIKSYYVIFVVPHKTEKIKTYQSYDRTTEINRINSNKNLTEEQKESIIAANGNYLNTINQALGSFEFSNKRKQDQSSVNSNH